MPPTPFTRTELTKLARSALEPVVVDRDGDAFVISLRGPMDHAACEELDRSLADAEASDASRVLLNLDAVKSLDARVLHLILRASRRSAQNGNRLRVTRGNGHVASIFRLTALDQSLRFDE